MNVTIPDLLKLFPECVVLLVDCLGCNGWPNISEIHSNIFWLDEYSKYRDTAVPEFEP